MASEISDGIAYLDVCIDGLPESVPEPGSGIRQGGKGIAFLWGRLGTYEEEVIKSSDVACLKPCFMAIALAGDSEVIGESSRDDIH